MLLLAAAEVSQATVDLTGDWYVAGPALFPTDVTLIPIVQTGTDLQFDGIDGYIDPSDGSFGLDFPCNVISFCPFCWVYAQASADGNTFAGAVYTRGPSAGCGSPTCACRDVFAVGPAYGSRSPCGNGVVDPGETCDDGNLGRNGDCCRLGCSLAAAGQACTSDGQICTSDVCDAAGTCTHPPGNAGTACRAALNVCDVAESCNGVDSLCPADAKQPDGTACSDGQFCNGEEAGCQAGVCQSGTPPCALFCDEANDQCVTACPSAPQTCRTAQKSYLVVKRGSARQKLVWKLIKGAPTSQTEFGDPTGTADYALCIFAGTASPLVNQAVIPADANRWSVLGTKGYTYRDPTAAAGGIDKIELKGSTEDAAKVRVHGEQAGLPDLPLPLFAPVSVQLFNGDNGLCWGSSYGAEQLLRNDTGRLKAKTP